MRTFFDSSAFAKRYVDEPGSEAVDRACAGATELGLAVICVPEIISALNRRVREKALSRRDYGRAKEALLEDVRDADIVHLTPPVVAAAIRILEASAARAMDALHIACAAEWNADIFISSDKRQISAAKKAGLRTKRA